MIQYELIRSHRKTLSMHITKEASVEVRAPLKMSKTDIDKFVASNEKWITSHLARRELLNSEKAAFKLNYDDMAMFCGKEYPICPRDGGGVGFDGECFFLHPGLTPEDIKRAVIQIYKTAAKRILIEKVDTYAKQMKVRPAAVKITSAKTRWGSCSGKNIVNFSWRLIMADESAIDYVVIHELAHIKEHNHSSQFWAVVEGVLPDYKKRRLKLNELHERLSKENWDVV